MSVYCDGLVVVVAGPPCIPNEIIPINTTLHIITWYVHVIGQSFQPQLPLTYIACLWPCGVSCEVKGS